LAEFRDLKQVIRCNFPFKFHDMTRIITSVFLFVLLAAGALQGAGQKQDLSRTFPVGQFSSIEVEGNFKVFLYQSEAPYVKVLAPSDDMYEALDIRTTGGELRISVHRRTFNLSRVELHIGFRELRELRVAGGLKLVTEGFLELGDFRIILEGGGNVDMKVKSASMEVISTGGAVFDLSGVTGRLSVKVAGAGHVNARELTAREVTFRVEGVGFGSVHATHLLDVKIEGVGKVTYQGTPEVKRIIEGLGKVEQY